MRNTKYLTMKEAGEYMGTSYRWLQRHWDDLSKVGVEVLRVPLDAPKGRLLFERSSLDKYLSKCRITVPELVIKRP